MLQIECEDSGNGFAPDRACADYAGRGLALVAALAQEVEVKGASSTVRVVFSW